MYDSTLANASSFKPYTEKRNLPQSSPFSQVLSHDVILCCYPHCDTDYEA